MPTKAKINEDAQLIHPLPGESEIEASLLDQAVEVINQTYIRKGLETARDIGEYVLKTFFDNGQEAIRQMRIAPSGVIVRRNFSLFVFHSFP